MAAAPPLKLNEDEIDELLYLARANEADDLPTYLAEVQKLLKASGLTYTMHSAGTTVEGSWDEVMRVIGQAHSVVHQVGPQRIQTSMRVGTR